MKKPTSPRLKSRSADAWDRQWQQHWSKVGLPGYELPVDLIVRGLPPAVRARLNPA